MFAGDNNNTSSMPIGDPDGAAAPNGYELRLGGCEGVPGLL